MLINVSQGEECRIAILENGRLSEIYMERESNASHVGNIYMGKVTNVEAGIQAAFVDFGLGRNGFLHISDLLPTYFGGKNGEDDFQESVGRKLGRRDRPPIQRCLRRGDTVMVQIIKEGIGTKGPTLSTYLSIPGRILVMMPGMENFGVSRKIEDDKERRRLRKILDELNPVEGVGFIVRTAGMGKSKAEIEKDLKYLTGIWETIQQISKDHRAPVELYTEGDLVTRTVRDVYGADVDKIIIDDEEVAAQIKDFVKPSAKSRTTVEYYGESVPLFHAYGVERELEMINSRHVPLPSGGSLVIDSTEAVVAIDVNSGKFREHADAETTAFKTDMEAADEIPRQLKLRDLGGVIICDFIDLRFDRHRRQLEERLYENFKRDKAKTRVLRMSEFGIIEITRQRQRASLKRAIYYDCPHCKGAGLVKTPESMSIDIMRRLNIAVDDGRVVKAEVRVAPDVALFLNNHRRRQLADLEDDTGKSIQILSDLTIGLDGSKWDLFDEREAKISLEGFGPGGVAEENGGGGSSGGRGGRRRRGRDRGGRDGPREGGRDGEQQGASGEKPAGRDRGRDGRPRDEDEANQPERPAARQRQYDSVRPKGVELEKAGVGYRGPQVVAPPVSDEGGYDDRDSDVEDREGGAADDRGGDRHGAGRGEGRGREDEGDREGGEESSAEGSQGVASEGRTTDGGPNDPLGEAGRRRRRRRRGGRGRRRNRQLDENGNPIPQPANGEGGGAGPSDGAAAEDRGPRDAGDSEFGRDSAEPDDRDEHDEEDESPVAVDHDAPRHGDSEFGDAPSAIGEDRADSMGDAPSAVGRDDDDDDDDESEHLSDVLREAREDVDEDGESALETAARNPGELSPTDDRGDEAPAAEDDGDDGEADKPAARRGRRSRGGRGRGRKTADTEEAPAKEKAAEPEAEKPAAKPRRAPSAKAAKPAAEKKAVRPARGKVAAKPAAKAAAPKRVPPSQPATPPAIEIVKTGSADKHLANDEPIEPQPMRRPRSYRDLDEIPDDFD